MIKGYYQFIKENNEEENLSLQYEDIKKDISDLISKSLDVYQFKTTKEFISSFIKNPNDIHIEGLIDDSNIYEFYLKYRNDIDQILLDIKFYDEIPSEIGIFSIYDYIIKGTKKSISEIVNMISE